MREDSLRQKCDRHVFTAADIRIGRFEEISDDGTRRKTKLDDLTFPGLGPIIWLRLG